MPRPDKVAAVTDIKERLESSNAVFLTEYAGLSVKAQQALRRGLRDSEAEFKVVKMTLARRAASELELAELDELLSGPTGIAFASGDPVTAAKALTDFADANDRLVIKGGLLGSDFLPPEKVTALAKIEPREVLLAKIAGAAKAPLGNMAGLMAAFTRNAASLIKQLLDKREAEGPAAAAAPEAEAAEPEAPTAESTEATAEEAVEPAAADSADSPDSADSADSPDSSDSADSPDEGDSVDAPEASDSADSPEESEEDTQS